MAKVRLEYRILDSKHLLVKTAEMSEELRGKGTIYTKEVRGDILYLSSVSCPAISHYQIYINGKERNRDNRWSLLSAKEHRIKDMIDFIQEINKIDDLEF